MAVVPRSVTVTSPLLMASLNGTTLASMAEAGPGPPPPFFRMGMIFRFL